jgi:hypothetical protein
MASLLWKREQRCCSRGSRYWLDHWLKAEGTDEAARAAYNLYMRDYMRRYRARPKRRSKAPRRGRQHVIERTPIKFAYTDQHEGRRNFAVAERQVSIN